MLTFCSTNDSTNFCKPRYSLVGAFRGKFTGMSVPEVDEESDILLVVALEMSSKFVETVTGLLWLGI
jgi:hypothetical protein